MCGGIAFDFELLPFELLATFFLPEELAAFQQQGCVESFFWSRRPVLPAIMPGTPGGVRQLFDWGNREKEVNLPRTGWARCESVSAGTWTRLKPTGVIIPATRGCEKKVWFDIDHGIEGLLVERDGAKRVYMVTEAASPEYLALTGHDRMPKLLKSQAPMIHDKTYPKSQ